MEKKKAPKKKQRRKRGIKPDAVLTAPNFFGVTNLTSTREENLFPSRFFFLSVIPSAVEKSRSKTLTLHGILRLRFTPLGMTTGRFLSCTLCSLCELISSDEALPRCSGERRPRCR